MKESTEKFLRKVSDVCEEGTIWKVFFGIYCVLFVINMLLCIFSKKKQKPSWLNSALIGAGMGSTHYYMDKYARKKAEKTEA